MLKDSQLNVLAVSGTLVCYFLHFLSVDVALLLSRIQSSHGNVSILVEAEKIIIQFHL